MSKSTPSVPREYPSIVDLTQSERHTLLMSERRRLVVEIIERESPPIELSELAIAVAAREEGCDPSSDETLDSVEITLHHNHLPKMDALGVVNYDPGQHQVTF